MQVVPATKLEAKTWLVTASDTDITNAIEILQRRKNVLDGTVVGKRGYAKKMTPEQSKLWVQIEETIDLLQTAAHIRRKATKKKRDDYIYLDGTCFFCMSRKRRIDDAEDPQPPRKRRREDDGYFSMPSYTLPDVDFGLIGSPTRSRPKPKLKSFPGSDLAMEFVVEPDEVMEMPALPAVPVRVVQKKTSSQVKKAPVKKDMPRTSKSAWLAPMSLEEKAAWAEKRAALDDKKKGTTKRKRKSTGRTGGSKRARTGGYGGNNIIYPNVVGRGAYYFGGGIGWSKRKGFHGNAGGYITDADHAQIQGLGEYTVRKNSLVSAIDMGMDPPRVRNTNMGEATVVNHREYLGDLLTGPDDGTGKSAFTLQNAGYILNPGNSTTFPFLAKIATQFQEWEARGIIFELKSLCSDFASSLALGSMFGASEYNVLHPAPTTKVQLENMEYASSAKPSKSIIIPIECDPRNDVATHLYVAKDNEYLGGDKRLYDLSKVYLGSYGCPNFNKPIAEIWVSYEIALFKPEINENDPPEEMELFATFQADDVIDGRPLLGATQTGGTLPVTCDGNATVTFPNVPEDRSYFVQYYNIGTTATGPAVSPVALGGAVLQGVFPSNLGQDLANYVECHGTATSAKCDTQMALYVPANTAGGGVTLVGNTFAPANFAICNVQRRA